MESEAETDIGETSVAEQPSKVEVKPRKPKRDPNEEAPFNWQRKPHLADRMPPLDLREGFSLDDPLRLVPKSEESLVYSVGDFVFIAKVPNPPQPHLLEDVGAPPAAFSIARIMQFKPSASSASSSVDALVNWLVRPDDVMFQAKDSRELYLTFQTEWINCSQFRGRCVVQCKQEIKSLARYRGRPAQFWFARLFDVLKRKLWDVVPVANMKSLGSILIDELSLSVTYAVLNPGQAKKVGETSRKRKPQDEPEEEVIISEEELKEKAKAKRQWPFRYYNFEARELFDSKKLPERRSSQHVEVDDWPGQPLRFYTEIIAPARTRKGVMKFRLLDAPNTEPIPGFETDIDDIKPVIANRPWLQHMPQGYLPRGEDATSTPVSLPKPGLSEFVSTCQTNYAESIDVKPSAVNFLDACCSIFISSSNNIEDAYVTVSRLSRKLLREPDMSPADLDTFKRVLDPFARSSWHQLFKAIGDKPITELCHYYWVDYPLQPTVPSSKMLWDGKDEVDPGMADDEEVICAMCLSTSPPEWQSLPGYVPLPLRPELADAKLVALCMRCARLWCRYKAQWISPSKLIDRVEDLEQQPEWEPELLEDTRSFMLENERRSKRRTAASEKKEATARKREEIKILKKAAKEAKKSGQAVPADLEQRLAATRASKASTPAPDESQKEKDLSTGKIKAAKKDMKKETKKAASKKDPQESLKRQYESDSEDEGRASKKRGPNFNQLSLDQGDQMLDELELVAKPTPNSMKPCVVCGQVDPSMPILTCASCGLNVHSACYGLSYQSDSAQPWNCDCCENSWGFQVADMNYQCVLCPPRLPTYASWLNGQKVAPPDALKMTAGKSWCHMRCAVWTPGVQFGDATHYRDIDTSQIDLEARSSNCKICLEGERQSRVMWLPSAMSNQADSRGETPIASVGDGSSTTSNHQRLQNSISAQQLATLGSKVKCDLCQDRFHVSCAADKGFSLGFTKDSNPRPVIVCTKHSEADLVPMSKYDMNLNMSVMQMHITRNRAAGKSHISPMDMVAALHDAEVGCQKAAAMVPQVFPLPLDSTSSKPCRVNLKCEKCGNYSASFWHAKYGTPVESEDDPVLCPLCYHDIKFRVFQKPGFTLKREQFVQNVFTYFSQMFPDNVQASVTDVPQ